MLTVAELQREREARGRVNHETYKQLLEQVQARIRARAENKTTELLWQVPPFVPGRPVYTVSHAARYVSEKLRRGGFQVVVAAPQPDVQMLYITWKTKPDPTPRRQRRRRDNNCDGDERRRHVVSDPTGLREASRTLENLKARLRIG